MNVWKCVGYNALEWRVINIQICKHNDQNNKPSLLSQPKLRVMCVVSTDLRLLVYKIQAYANTNTKCTGECQTSDCETTSFNLGPQTTQPPSSEGFVMSCSLSSNRGYGKSLEEVISTGHNICQLRIKVMHESGNGILLQFPTDFPRVWLWIAVTVPQG